MKRLLVLLSFFVSVSLTHAQVQGLPDFTELAEKQGQAVVNISTTHVVKGGSQMMPFPFDENDPEFEFFKRFIPKMPGGGKPREFENKSLGSGFIISNDGYIMTNAHVIDGADQVTVRLVDKREFKAKVIGADKRTDVALIKIEAGSLPVVKLANMANLKVGEWVVAIGSPFGFDNSVTAGIVSAKGRALPQENYVPFIQTDVAINPGNSGGPLFNMRGEVVGINSQIYSRSGGYMGVSFAIPIDVAMEIQSQLRASGKVSRGRLGVVIQEVNKELADSLGLSKPMGAVVNAVEKGGPAEKSGLEPGDVILKFDGKAINNSADLPRIVGMTKPGTRALVQVWRRGVTRDISVTVGEIIEERPASLAQSQGKKPVEQVVNRLGLVLSELGAEQRKELKMNSGLLIDEVRGTAARSDLRAGDIVIAVISKGATTELKSVDQFNKILAQFAKGSSVTLLIRRGEMQTFVTIKGLNGD
jgi:serine protease Do